MRNKGTRGVVEIVIEHEAQPGAIDTMLRVSVLKTYSTTFCALIDLLYRGRSKGRSLALCGGERATAATSTSRTPRARNRFLLLLRCCLAFLGKNPALAVAHASPWIL